MWGRSRRQERSGACRRHGTRDGARVHAAFGEAGRQGADHEHDRGPRVRRSRRNRGRKAGGLVGQLGQMGFRWAPRAC
jgi:hypothetical protein